MHIVGSVKLVPYLAVLGRHASASVTSFSRRHNTVAFSATTRNHVSPFSTVRAIDGRKSKCTRTTTTTTTLRSTPVTEEFNNKIIEMQDAGIPVLGCDASEVSSFSAGLWEILGQVSAVDDEQVLCLVMEKIPMPALKAFVDDFFVLKTQIRLIEHLPELSRITVSLLDNGAGPALIVEAAARTADEIAAYRKAVGSEATTDRATAEGALAPSSPSVVVGAEACPYARSPDLAAVGLEAKGVSPGPVAYRFSPTSDACVAVAAFWQSCIELLSAPPEEISTTLLSLPNVDGGDHARFAAVVEVISRYLCLYRGDGIFGLVHFHPEYDRGSIYPLDKPLYGHLPPMGWLRPMMRKCGSSKAADTLTDEELALSNYQRRAPHTMINILRVSHLDAATGGKSIVDLDIGGGVIEKASGINLYSKNAIRLAAIGKANLEAGLGAEVAMQN
eukprot:CAMPEP_0113299020 /NCGR_PEP_ID=MMETSP0010_2-20120614/1221_1 /TAXON_ID=216773 ORGANISM="Corethron hystrix, Strain 308" /NCGR_SAMPLE_ID=MMETSP0010_2 /ASSEMBLY_ACC=CAM_ASM_000155 /LENGTH=445 /DNA_ID=CAMNT_0000152169 /DNA_START=70 /DNA_END=1411 /DNA_ORIENTATION=- /assembly_acc=CAM_ASM_000155